MDSNLINVVCDGSKLDTVANIITSIVGLINLAFIVVIYFKDKKDNKNKESMQEIKEQESLEKEYKYNWYKLINVSDRINELNQIMDQIVTSCNMIYNDANENINDRKSLMKKETTKIDISLKKEKNKFTSILKCLNEEDNKIMSCMYNDFQEEYFECFTIAVAQTNEIDFSDLQKCLTNIITKYYELGHDILTK